jgi:hypothetical protein
MDLAAYLVDIGGITSTSSMEQVTAALRRYAEDGVRGFHVNPTHFGRVIDVVVELAGDSYEDCLRAFVEARLTQQRATAAGDGEPSAPPPPPPPPPSASSAGSTAADAR